MSRKQNRSELVKGYVTESNKEALQNICEAMQKSVSDVLNECTIVIIRNHLDAQPKRNDTPPFTGGARPKPHENRTHFYPGQRPSFGAVPRMRITV